MNDIDILMIAHNRAVYTETALGRLLDTCDRNMRVWLWLNGDNQDTLSVVKCFLNHPRLYPVSLRFEALSTCSNEQSAITNTNQQVACGR